MNRTQIYLPKTQTDALRNLARKQRITMSEAIRMILREKLPGNSHLVKSAHRETLGEAAKRISTLGKKGPRDLASHMDQYLYGGK